MFAFLKPEFQGEILLPALRDDFISRLGRRVQTGLFVPGNRQRADYVVVSSSGNRVRFRAASGLTAFNVGLNEVLVERRSASAVHYEVHYRTWTLYCVVLSAVIALSIVLVTLAWDPQRALRSTMTATLFWSQVGFWGVLWPWVLTAFHKKAAARCLERILLEVVREA